jgi:hypothetical protein
MCNQGIPEAEHSSESSSLSTGQKFSTFTELEGSLLCSQEPVTGSFPKL